MAGKRNGTIYIGVTSDLIKRIWEHKNNMVEGFTKRYGVHQLVWYEVHESMESAIDSGFRRNDVATEPALMGKCPALSWKPGKMRKQK